MKLKKILPLLVLFVGLATANLSAQDASSRVPVERFGLGAAIGQGSFGPVFAYALQPNFHIGAQFSFFFDGGTDKQDSKSYLSFAPYGKYLFEPIKSFHPYIQGAFELTSLPEAYFDPADQSQTKYETVTKTALTFYVGGEWFPYSSVGVYAGVQVLDFQLDPMRVIGGIGRVNMGIEWFFD
ncbi:MAG: hypothetical protein ACLFQX_12960 [Candidatus Kapaibacterium sp.]